ncbi:SipW-dependent-type signal peptide-containing protein [Blautia sp. An81]|uniref:SipW-dependent-type signal peptide-containing protein n=1 Tax=Blautia sp. An81 TaxID=1965659 RepID=UPI000B39A37E|nr:SipW-dependent-type signal peptide-containing protein [Blautia sp. An81]OUN25290.1 hypothetical protein B5G33_18310 [Blautia sp. An81]
MKNKKVLSMVAALGLVAVVGIGGTLAYFNDSTNELTNTFTMAQQGIEMELWESGVKTDGNGGYDQDLDAAKVVAGEDGAGNQYKDLQPGADVYKDPTITIKANSVDCYVYASIKTYNNAKNTITAISDSWKALDGIETAGSDADGAYTIKYYVYWDKTANTPQVVRKSDDPQDLIALFKNVDIATDLTDATKELSDIVVKSSAVQASNIEIADAQAEGLKLLGYVAQ